MAEQIPPQITDTAVDITLTKLLDLGTVEFARNALGAIKTFDRAFNDQLIVYGLELNERSTESYWPSNVLQISAAVALYGYRHSGFQQTLDAEAIDTANFFAEIEGTPSAYIGAAYEDPNISRVLEALLSTPTFQGDEGGGYRQVAHIGMGLSRYVLSHALR
ncbi:MAG: hypothetical protein QG629_671 [Patescibacteria group bacterium]|nr:hypothetical protein [Patescibacteria group bacterium]